MSSIAVTANAVTATPKGHSVTDSGFLCAALAYASRCWSFTTSKAVASSVAYNRRQFINFTTDLF
jgi:hypothetical protein